MKYEEIEKLFDDAGKIQDPSCTLLSINENLKLMITSFKTTNKADTKKTLKEFFNFIFVYILEKIEIIEAVAVIKLFGENIFDLSNIFSDKLNSEIKLYLQELEEVCKNEIEEFLNDSLKLKKFIIFSILICFLTQGIENTNQMLTNYLVIISILNSKINFESELKILIKIHLINTLSILSQSTKTYNPDLIVSLEKAVTFLKHKVLISKEINNVDLTNFQNNYNPENYFRYIIFKLIDDHISRKSESNLLLDENSKTCIFFSRILNNINSLIILNKDEINFSIIFRNLVENLKIFKNNTPNNLTLLISGIIELYERYSLSNNMKKNVEINFMKLKKKAIVELEPDIEPSYLGKTFLNRSDKEKKDKAIARKIKSTKKQAIRNLKNEAKVIDIQRQKKMRNIDDKRKEDLKASNQFIEQQNIEYKKMITSQGSKRFKIKRGKGQMRGGKK